jgi:flotillin
MIRDAQNAENEANQKIAEEQAGARQRAESAQKVAEASVLQKKNQLRGELAKMEAQAKSIENEAAVAAETARATAEQDLQGLRSELEKARLYCDMVLPAEAARQAAEARARGEAAPLMENGKAAAAALQAVAAEWKAAGQGGREVYLLQQLRTFVEAAVERVAQTQLGELQIVDGGDGRAYTAFVANFPAAVARVMAETARAVGVDVRSLLGSKDVTR